MYLPAKFGSHRSHGNGDKNYDMYTLEKAELTASIRDIERFLESGLPIYNSEVPDTAGRKTRRRRRTHAIAKLYAFHANAINLLVEIEKSIAADVTNSLNILLTEMTWAFTAKPL